MTRIELARRIFGDDLAGRLFALSFGTGGEAGLLLLEELAFLLPLVEDLGELGRELHLAANRQRESGDMEGSGLLLQGAVAVYSEALAIRRAASDG